jgi:hypothetical protein
MFVLHQRSNIIAFHYFLIQVTGRTRRTHNPIFDEIWCASPPDLPKRPEQSGELKWRVSETYNKAMWPQKKRAQSQPTKMTLLESLKRSISSSQDTALNGLQRGKTETIPRRSLPSRPNLYGVSNNNRYFSKLSRIKKTSKPQLPSIGSIPPIEWRRSAPIPKTRNLFQVSPPRRGTTTPLLEGITPPLPPRPQPSPPPRPEKDMRKPPLPNQPKNLIPVLRSGDGVIEYKDDNFRDSRSSRSPDSRRKKVYLKNISSEPPMKLEALKPKYYDAHGKPVEIDLPISIW